MCIFFFQAEDGIRDLVRSRGLGDVYKRQGQQAVHLFLRQVPDAFTLAQTDNIAIVEQQLTEHCSRLSHFQRVELLETIAARFSPLWLSLIHISEPTRPY